MADFWPHETAVSWVRSYMKKHPLKKGVGMPQMERDFVSTMDATMKDVNENYDVDGLCSSLPKRLADLKKSKGDRLNS